ncbi:D-3-phosphoglycerate dehydrogenase [Peptoniphilus asaccharolyticus DSM 20463]|uniref:D-3-phosphoglycerate dehydrogenase n=1 Tax=Peptoniphilus asaccharolyticus DSM 20463 TaxID=573058 RepID=A0A1W1UXZ9_PEPAS|nr:phosphoglycerate dehydrogenase [Peptoniphilus asaccharolyticus]MBL7575328.1 phosphoglycerate dehydrogenase [Peptoniphilus asaccharolyticus]SMB85946.1 D-3-phosphoglycerate dehydrogenase [Peptoniphilus asaccharolyticus DSM 20463]
MKNYTIKIINNISKKALNLLADNFLIEEENEPVGILVRSAEMHDYDFSPKTLYVGRAGAGVNNIPIEKCSEKGIVVCNAPGGNANAVKELTLMALLLASRKVVEGIEWTKTLKGQDGIDKLVETGKKEFVGPELYGKKLGVIGLGATGQLVAETGINMGMQVYGHDPFISLKNALHLNSKVNYVTEVRDIFKNCDYVTIHIPKTKDTENFINRELINIAKDGIRIINIARGGLVDIEALREALESGKVAKYIVDFPDKESLELPNTINIPHLGASTPESEENSAVMVVNEMMEYLSFGNIKNSVNFPDCDMGVCNSVNRITVNHRNIPNMIGQITAILAEEGINIANLLNRHKGDWAYTMIDIDSEVNEGLKEKLNGIDGVVRVRFMK